MANGAEKTHGKSELRQLLRTQRAEKFGSHGLLHIAKLPEVEKATTIATYFSYGDEPDTFTLNQLLITLGKNLLLPRINGDSLEWVNWNGDIGDTTKHGLIPEPLGIAITDLSQIDVVLVPALAIDRDGFRLGQGKGFYDRALKDLSAITIGIIFPHELMDEPLPRDTWDIPVTLIETAR
jgi:5-formyltetrahydrofolate cyclo-ligase